MSFNIGPVFPSFDPRVSSLDKYRPDFIRPRCNWLFPGREFKLIEAHTAVEPRRCSEKHSWYREISHVLLAEERKEGIPTNYTAIGKRKLHVSNRNEYPSFLTHLLTYLLIYLVTVDPFPRTNRRIGVSCGGTPLALNETLAFDSFLSRFLKASRDEKRMNFPLELKFDRAKHGENVVQKYIYISVTRNGIVGGGGNRIIEGQARTRTSMHESLAIHPRNSGATILIVLTCTSSERLKCTL